MKTTDRGVKFIAKHEGAVKQSGLHWMYDDATGKPVDSYEECKGFPTIGYGHLVTEDEQSQGLYLEGIDEAGALELLSGDLTAAEDIVNKLVVVELNEDQFDALVDFTFNVGGGNLKSSTLLKFLNQGNFDAVPEQMLRWNKSKGKVMEGLNRRRTDEGELFMGRYVL